MALPFLFYRLTIELLHICYKDRVNEYRKFSSILFCLYSIVILVSNRQLFQAAVNYICAPQFVFYSY
jgi:hypothetical protein